MKKICLLLPFIILFSCSVQKRKYQKGYYVSWKHTSQNEKTTEVAKTNTLKPAAVNKKVVSTAVAEQPEALLAAAKNEQRLSIAATAKKPSVFKKDEPCDDLVFKDGTELKARIIEINTYEIKYKKCDLPDGPLYVAKKSDVFMIKYVNGTREVFKNEPEPVSQNTPKGSKPINPANLRTHPLSIVSLIFAILGIWPLFLIGPILAIVLANTAIRRIKEHPEIYKGETLADVARAIGIVILAIYALIILIVIIALLAIII